MKDCLEEKLNQKNNLNIASQGSDKCKEDVTSEKVERIIQSTTEVTKTHGSGANRDFHEWTRY